jgi:hypothetical protein
MGFQSAGAADGFGDLGRQRRKRIICETRPGRRQKRRLLFVKRRRRREKRGIKGKRKEKKILKTNGAMSIAGTWLKKKGRRNSATERPNAAPVCTWSSEQSSWVPRLGSVGFLRVTRLGGVSVSMRSRTFLVWLLQCLLSVP